jgi:arylformamidase
MSTLHIDADQPLIDLSMPIEAHWRFKPVIRVVDKTVAGCTFRSTVLEMGAHGFTHVDAESHVDCEGRSLGGSDVNELWGPCVVLDLTWAADSHAFTAEDLAKAALLAGGVWDGDIALLRTDQARKHPTETPRFWTSSPFLTRGAAEWLRDRSVAAVGYDFPQDRAIRSEYEPAWQDGELLDDWPCHEILLKSGIAQIEYLTNLGALPTRCVVFAVPIKIPSADGAPARVFALRHHSPIPIATFDE